jgi:hypothetical protein
MMSQETRERYRRMTNAERLKITLEMIREATPYLLEGPPDVVERRFELLRRQNDERNRRMLEGIARTKKHHEGLDQSPGRFGAAL